MNNIISSREYTYKEIQDIIYVYKGLYPFIQIKEIGKSVLGRNIKSISIGEADETVLYVGGIHGCERLTTLLLLKFIDKLAKSINEDREISGIPARRIMKGRRIEFVPLLNPDGYEISLLGAVAAGKYANKANEISGGKFEKWSANVNGVDINHNFDAGWDILHKLEQEAKITRPSIKQYGGVRCESEPETQCIVNLCRNENIHHLVAYHSQGEEIYWHYGDNTPLVSKYMAKIMSASSGYAMSHPKGIASHGGLKDWFINEFSRPGFTIEIGKGENPLDAATLDDIYNQIEEMMLIGLIM